MHREEDRSPNGCRTVVFAPFAKLGAGFSIPYNKLVIGKIQVPDPQAQAFAHPQAAAIYLEWRKRQQSIMRV